MRNPATTLALSAALTLQPLASSASQACAADAMVVFDASASMGEIGFNGFRSSRMDEARSAVEQAMPYIAPFRRVGLMVYGPGPGTYSSVAACKNISVRFAPMQDAGPAIIDTLGVVVPDGETPLTDAVARAAEVLDYENRPAMVLLVTDGRESCGGSPCSLAGELAASARNLTVHVIGFKVRASFFSINAKEDGSATAAECLAIANGGQYFPAESVEDLAAALEESLGCQHLSMAPAELTAPATIRPS